MPPTSPPDDLRAQAHRLRAECATLHAEMKQALASDAVSLDAFTDLAQTYAQKLVRLKALRDALTTLD